MAGQSDVTVDLKPKLVAEFVGTFLLVFTVGCNVLGQTPVWAGVSIACVLMVMIYALGGISGANFNPAVSVALAISNTLRGPSGDPGSIMTWKLCAMYSGTQILAGLVAAFSYCILFWDGFTLGPSKGFGFMAAGFCELFYTFMLCFVVLNVAVARKFANRGGNQWYGLAIGFVIVAGAYGAGIVSGGCFNPAVAIGIDASSMGFRIRWCLIYTFFELVGATLAVLAFKVIRPGEFGSRDPDSETPVGAKLVSEFLGTFMLVLTIGLNVLGNSSAGAFSIAASLMCMIYALGDVSGAHFNPAVTVAIMASGMDPGFTKNIRTGMTYMLVQILGGVAAALTYATIYSGKTFPLEPMPGFGWGHVAVAEIVFTFFLCYVVLCTAVASTKSESMFGLAIGSCVTVGGFAIGSISGGSLNPAVSLGIAFSHGMLENALFYSLFELIGAALAAGAVMVTHRK